MSDFDSDDALLNSLMSDGSQYETTYQLEDSCKYDRKVAKRETIRIAQRTEAAKFLTTLPALGTTRHILSNAKYDFWTWVAVVCDLMGGRIAELYGSTWTMSRINVEDMFSQYDQGRIGKISILTGVYFKRRESSVYATLLAGLASREGRFVCFENHTKVLLLGTDPNYITIEGSANFTSNPRLEQYTMTNDKGLYVFHRTWMEEMLNRG